MTQITISSAFARVEDQAAVDRVLAPIPVGEEVRQYVGSPFGGPHYDAGSQRLFMIGSDGAILVCITVAGLSEDNVGKVMSAFSETDHALDFYERVRMAVDEAVPGVMHSIQ